MNPENLRQKLLSAARADGPSSDHVPYAFEKRIMARIGRRVPPDSWTALGAFLWRAVAPCCAVMLLAGISSYSLHPSTDDLSAQLDAVLLADLDTSGTDSP